MRSIFYSRYGSPDVLQVRDTAKPIIRDGGVLVKVRAASVNPYDWHFMRGEPYFMRLFSGLRAPRRKGLGLDFSGEVESVASVVTQFQPGDEVFGMSEGAFAGYVCAAEKGVAIKPSRLTFEQAAAVPLAALTALQGLRDTGQLRPAQKVLIIGAAGGVGTFAIQIARVLGGEVTGVCSTGNLELVRSLGADHVIDYTREDFTRSGTKYDLILQLAGMHSPSQCRHALTEKGRLVLSSGDSNGRWIGPVDRILKASMLSPFVSQTLAVLDTKRSQEDLNCMTELIDGGKVRPVIDRTYSLGEVPEAIRYLEQGHARGKVVIRM